MPDFNNQVMEPDAEGLNRSRNIFDDKKAKFYSQAIRGPKADLWYSAMVAKIDALRRNYNLDVVERPTNRKNVDSEKVFKIKCLSEESVDKFKAELLGKGFS
jgi:hypothetical protein